MHFFDSSVDFIYFFDQNIDQMSILMTINFFVFPQFFTIYYKSSNF